MTLEAVVDNDVLVKGACYSILGELLDGLGGAHSAGVLGVARFVVRDRLDRHPGIRDGASAEARWTAFLALVEELEPTANEVELATSIEEAASTAGVALDSGESQLCAMALTRRVPLVITGDKRAIRGIESIRGQTAELVAIENRLACLEQVVAGVVRRIGALAARARICAEPEVDKVMSICFECSRAEEHDGFVPVGLDSYIRDLRSSAPTVLVHAALLD